MSTASALPPLASRFTWLSRGDVNAFFGLTLDNISDMILMAGLLAALGFPSDFVLTRMIPGTAVGVLVGDLIFTIMGIRLARRTGRADVTAMPLGLDTPSTFGATLLILGPAFQAARGRGLTPEDAARHAWYVGIAMILASGIFKLGCAAVSGWIRRTVPRAGLLGSLVSIALVIISFMPLLDVAATPVAGIVSLAVILVTLTGRWRLPGNIPGALAAVVVGCLVYYALMLAGLGPGLGPRPDLRLHAVLPMPAGDWLGWFGRNWPETLNYIWVALPLALATVVGGIDCAESAAAAGDDYRTGRIIAAEGLATVVGGLFGGVIQSTPYIGHPAYKAMGARSGYTLATALFVGAAGVFGYFNWVYFLVPKAVAFPILIFVGLEITAHSFQVVDRRHFPALAIACVPALAYLASIPLNQVLSDGGPTAKAFSAYSPEVRHLIQTITMLAAGFIITSLLWSTALARILDGRPLAAARVFAATAVLAFFGVIHSPLPSGEVGLPWKVVARLREQGRLEAGRWQTPYHWAAAYAAAAGITALIGLRGRAPSDDVGPAV